jgi:serine/threonine protein kinase
MQDLKADNILVEMTGVCKISDFGISKRTEELQGDAFTAMQGSVFWMAPEVIYTRGHGYNNKIDIWSVGCVVLEMWAGMRPWNGEEMLAVMFKLYQSKQPPPIPEDVVLSEEADDFRRKCFAMSVCSCLFQYFYSLCPISETPTKGPLLQSSESTRFWCFRKTGCSQDLHKNLIGSTHDFFRSSTDLFSLQSL